MDEAAARALAEDVAASLCRFDFAAVVARFDPRMEQGLPRSQLERIAHRELDSLGTFTERRDARSRAHDGYVTTIVECAFERGSALVEVSLDDAGRIVGLRFEARPDDAQRTRKRPRALILAAPFTLAVPIAFVWTARALWDTGVVFSAFVVGSIGWTLAQVLRSSVAIGARRFARARAVVAMAVTLASVDEAARLASIATAGSTFAEAFSVGLGWAALEILFSLASAIGGAADDGAHGSRLLGIFERACATAYHIGAALLLAKEPLLLLVTIPVHSLIGLQAVWLRAQPLWLREAIIAASGAGVLVAGLALFEKL